MGVKVTPDGRQTPSWGAMVDELHSLPHSSDDAASAQEPNTLRCRR